MDQMLVAAIAGFLGGRGGAFLDELLKPIGAEIGADLLEKYRRWTGKNLGKVIEIASEMREESGRKRMDVPGRILFPLLEYASIEEDPSLAAKWAALLANAASEGIGERILPGYNEILHQLTPIQAQILDWIYETKNDTDVSEAEICQRFSTIGEDYSLLVSDMHRLQLIDGRRSVQTVPRMPSGMSGTLYGSSVTGLTTASHYSTIGVTPFGIGFIKACQPPPTAN